MEKFCDTLFEELKTFAASHKLSLHVIHLNKKLLGIEKSSDFPQGFFDVYKHVLSLQSFLYRRYLKSFGFVIIFFLFYQGTGSKAVIPVCLSNFWRISTADFLLTTNATMVFWKAFGKPYIMPTVSFACCTIAGSGF